MTLGPRPHATARCATRCASKVFAATARSRRNSSPSDAAARVAVSIIARARSRDTPYFAARWSTVSPGDSAGASGSSWNERHTTSTSAACSYSASAPSKRDLPMQHQGQAMSEQTSTRTFLPRRSGRGAMGATSPRLVTAATACETMCAMADGSETHASAAHDFHRARRRAALRTVLGRLLGATDDRLLSYEEVRRGLRAVEGHGATLQDVPLDAIVGSVGRYQDFTREFLPLVDEDRGRWVGVRLAMTGLEGVPPVELYRI